MRTNIFGKKTKKTKKNFEYSRLVKTLKTETSDYCIVILSHGDYFSKHEVAELKNKTFVIPHNIELIKYSNPGSTLLANNVKQIIPELLKCNVPSKKVHYEGYSDGFIAKSEVKPYSHAPGSQVINMQFEFSNNIPNFIMGIYKVMDGRIYPLLDYKEGQKEAMDNIITQLSEILPDDKVIKVHQITCHTGEYIYDANDINTAIIDAIIANIENISIDDIPDIKILLKNNDIHYEHGSVWEPLVVTDNLDMLRERMVDYFKNLKKRKLIETSQNSVNMPPKKRARTQRLRTRSQRSRSRTQRSRNHVNDSHSGEKMDVASDY